MFNFSDPDRQRAALLNPDRTAIKYGDDTALTYSELMVRNGRLTALAVGKVLVQIFSWEPRCELECLCVHVGTLDVGFLSS